MSNAKSNSKDKFVSLLDDYADASESESGNDVSVVKNESSVTKRFDEKTIRKRKVPIVTYKQAALNEYGFDSIPGYFSLVEKTDDEEAVYDDASVSGVVEKRSVLRSRFLDQLPEPRQTRSTPTVFAPRLKRAKVQADLRNNAIEDLVPVVHADPADVEELELPTQSRGSLESDGTDLSASSSLFTFPQPSAIAEDVPSAQSSTKETATSSNAYLETVETSACALEPSPVITTSYSVSAVADASSYENRVSGTTYIDPVDFEPAARPSMPKGREWKGLMASDVQGDSLTHLGVKTVSVRSSDLVDPHWRDAFKRGEGRLKPKEALGSSGIALSATLAPSRRQRSKNQINYLAQEVASKEHEYLERAAQQRYSKYQTQMKYGW